MKTVPYERLSSSIEPLKNDFERSNNYEFKFFFKLESFHCYIDYLWIIIIILFIMKV